MVKKLVAALVVAVVATLGDASLGMATADRSGCHLEEFGGTGITTWTRISDSTAYGATNWRMHTEGSTLQMACGK